MTRPRISLLIIAGALGIALAAGLAGLTGRTPAGSDRAPLLRHPRSPTADLGDPEHACRFWGIVGTGYPATLIEEHLRSGTVNNLRQLSGSNHDGWGFASFLSGTLGGMLRGPLVRRGRPPANHPQDADFDIAVDEMASLAPRAAVGHIRAASSGHFGLPDPHPFLEDGLAFAHNGSVSTTTMVGLLTQNDPAYLDTHPPEYVDGYIDSELLFLYLLKYRHAHPELPRAEALQGAAAALYELVAPSRLNFVMTAGDTLYALRCSGYDDYDPVRYYPDPGATSSVPDHAGKTEYPPFWVVASQPVGNELLGWAPIPPRTLGVFVPGEAPRFLSLSTGPTPVFYIPWAAVTDTIDTDADGYVSSFQVEFSPRVDWGTHPIFARVMAYFGEEEFLEVAVTDTFMVVAGASDTIRVPVPVRPPDRPQQIWDLSVQLYSPVDPAVPLAGIASDVEPRLADLHVEGSDLDGGSTIEPAGAGDPPAPPTSPATPDLPPAPDRSPEQVRIGAARPNPSDGDFMIPVHLGAGLGADGARVTSLEIWDARGALVWRSDRMVSGPGDQEVRWDGRNQRGERVSAGIYFCRVRAGGQSSEARLTVLR